ncbi:MAG: hypothetical protein MUC73_00375 [Cyclobacteriaceae bacterium]|nr:hypothetical protein [Cyclobacteriaceae bacterium]
MKIYAVISFMLLFMVFIPAYSQTDYVVLAKGDTLYGKVTHLNYGIEQKVQLVDTNRKKSVYSIVQVKAFHLKNDNYHVVKMFDRYKFMKLVVPGYASLYEYQEDDRTTWDGRYLYKMDGSGIDVPNISFKRRMVEFMKDCPQVAAQLDSGKLVRNDLVEIVQQYNACIENNTLVSKNESAMAEQAVATKISPWNELESAVKESATLEEKESVLEMISEARSKTERGEKIPNFILDGLKKSFAGEPALSELLTKAIDASIKQ